MLSNDKTLRDILKRVNQTRGMPAPQTHKDDRQGFEPHAAKIHHLLSDLYIELKDIRLGQKGLMEFEFLYAEKTAAGAQQIRSFFCEGAVLKSMLEAVESAAIRKSAKGSALDHNCANLELALMAYEHPDMVKDILPHLRKIGGAPMAYKRMTAPSASSSSSSVINFPEPGSTRH